MNIEELKKLPRQPTDTMSFACGYVASWEIKFGKYKGLTFHQTPSAYLVYLLDKTETFNDKGNKWDENNQKIRRYIDFYVRSYLEREKGEGKSQKKVNKSKGFKIKKEINMDSRYCLICLKKVNNCKKDSKYRCCHKSCYKEHEFNFERFYEICKKNKPKALEKSKKYEEKKKKKEEEKKKKKEEEAKKVEEEKKSLPKCVNCGELSNGGYHWCNNCFQLWRDGELKPNYKNQPLLIEDSDEE